MAGAGVSLRDVHKRYRIYRQRYRSLKEIALHRRFGLWEDRWALRGVSFDLRPGETLGLIGPNGAGKSTALKLMARILVPDAGEVEVHGRIGALLELGAGFQPDYTGRENVFLNASLLGLSRREIERRYNRIVAFAELEEHMDAPLRTYSSGMSVRLGFAIAAHIDPDVMLLDEILAVGDEAFQRKCFDHISQFKSKGGTIVLISHSMEVIRQFCTQVAWIENGELQQLGRPDSVADAYLSRIDESELESRPGGPAPALQLLRIRLLGAHGRPVDVVTTGEPLTVEISYRRHGLLEDPVMGVAIHRTDNLYIFGTNTALDGVSLKNLPSEGTICLRYPRLELLKGRYRISAAAYATADPGASALDFHDRRYAFRVESPSEDHGAVRLDHEWRLAG